MIPTKAEQALEIALELAKDAKSSVDWHNAFFGIGGKFGKLFPTLAEREEFAKTQEYQEIRRLRSELQQRDKAVSGITALDPNTIAATKTTP